MRGRKQWLLVAVLLALLVAPLGALADDGKAGALQGSQGASIANAFIKAVVARQGAVFLGTTGGNPTIIGDEDKPLLFGYPQAVNITGYPTLRIVAGGQAKDFWLVEQDRSQEPTVEGNTIVTRWLIEGVEVTERVSFFLNPYSNREDMALISYKVRNTLTTPLNAGIRSLLDIQVGTNDFAPFFLPGVGNVSTEQTFTSANMPDYFKAFESSTYAENSLRALGILKGFGMTTPDRFALVTWGAGRGQGAGIFGTDWDYASNSAAQIGDSAAAWWWNPRPLASNAEATFQLGYGLGGSGGGRAWFDAPARLDCTTRRFNATLWVSNTAIDTLRNGRATLTLPSGLAFAAGQSATAVIGDVPPGQVGSVTWAIEANPPSETDLTFQAGVTFENLSQPLAVQGTIHVLSCQGPTPFPSATATPRPVPEVPEPGSFLLLAAGLGSLGAYLKLRKR